MACTIIPNFSDPTDAAIDEIIASCNGDMRGAVKALLLVNEHNQPAKIDHHSVASADSSLLANWI